MNILKLNKLTSIQMADIAQLSAICDNFNPYYEEFSPCGETCFFLCYEDSKHAESKTEDPISLKSDCGHQRLVSFLSFLSISCSNPSSSSDIDSSDIHSSDAVSSEAVSFIADSSDADSSDIHLSSANPANTEAEITAMTHPDMRRLGLFSMLLNHAMAELESLYIRNICCALPPELQHAGLCKGFSHCEYLLKLESDFCMQQPALHQPVVPHPAVPHPITNLQRSSRMDHMNPHFTQHISEEFDIPSACSMYLPVVKDDSSLKSETFSSPVSAPVPIYSFSFSPNLVGLCNFSEESTFTNLWGVEIKKPYRNQGYGFQLMKYAITNYFKYSSKPLILNVSGTNEAACRLYKCCGFEVAEQISYYKL